MTETLRFYSMKRGTNRRRRLLHRHSVSVAKYLVPLIVLLVIVGIWITRDNHPMASFIGKDANFQVYINDVVQRRQDVIDSNLAPLFWESSSLRHVMDGIAQELPVPEWLLKNLNSGLCLVSGKNFQDFDNTLIVTKMTRVGCIAEKAARLLPIVKADTAGGLKLHYLPDASLYYAVRGRMLLLSMSRDELILALTLEKAKALTESDLAERVKESGGADIYCRLEPEIFEESFRPFEALSFALKFEKESIRFLVQGGFSDAFQQQYEMLLPSTTGQTLPIPFDTLFSVSMDFGKPLSQILDGLAKVFYETNIFPEWLWHSYRMPEDETEITSLQPLIASMLQTSDSRVRLGWFGMDSNEIMPVPLVAATFEANTDRMLFLFENIPATPETADEIDLCPRLNAEEMLCHVPFVGGPNLEPTLLTYNEGILFSSSLPLAINMKNTLPLVQGFNQQGNLYASVKPPEVADTLLDAARELAYSGLLRGYTPESLELAAKSWQESASRVKEAALLASWSEGRLRAEVKINMAADLHAPTNDETADTQSTELGES
ncbi:MAG: hypothetical protein GX117_15175 [Candidatus Hydrogenedentes bacterium]|nr:hypothetical protein [Candidatus Hydrogenedentota bacterium]